MFKALSVSEQAEDFKGKAKELRNEIEKKSAEVENLNRMLLADPSPDNLQRLQNHFKVLLELNHLYKSFIIKLCLCFIHYFNQRLGTSCTFLVL